MAVYDREQVVRLIADALAVHDTMIDERLNWMDFYHRGIIKDDYDERKNG